MKTGTFLIAAVGIGLLVGLAAVGGKLSFLTKERAGILPSHSDAIKISAGWATTTQIQKGSGLSDKVHQVPLTNRSAVVVRQSPTLNRHRPWDRQFLQSLKNVGPGDEIRFQLLADEFASGRINQEKSTNGDVIYISGTLSSPEKGRFFFAKQTMPGVAGEFFGVIEFPVSQRAYRIEPTGRDGGPELMEHRLDEVICIGLPRPTVQSAEHEAKVPPLKPGNFPNLPIPPYQNGVVPLESLHGATAVIYLDFQGGYTAAWGGVTYERPSISNDGIREVWERVAEDFMPFKINVTTDLKAFENARAGSRQHVIITPTMFDGTDKGGVAYMDSFNSTFDTPCWSFITYGKACAEACSHEVGHTLGLNHEGFASASSSLTYYEGQGSGETGWAPIMGVGYYRNISQWSKGEYLGANNKEDELALIIKQNNNITYRADDTGGTLADSRYLELYPDYSASAEGVIERTADTDAFRFTTSGGELALRADPVEAGPNLALQVALYDASDVLLASNNPQDTLWASIATNVPAGTYTFRVAGAGRNDPVRNGFSSYASLGYYSITGSVANARLPDRFVIPEHSPNGTPVGTVTASNPQGHALQFSIISGNTGGTFSIDPSGVLSVADNSLLDYTTLGRASQFPVQFELFVNIADLRDSTASEFGRRVVIGVEYVPAPPQIIEQPQDQTVPAGMNVSFRVVANWSAPYDTAPVAYQWFFDGAPVSHGTNSVLDLLDVQPEQSGPYCVAVSDSYGSVTSSTAHLSVITVAPSFDIQPVSRGAFPGLNAGFAAHAAGTRPISYQWQFNGMEIPPATSTSLALTNIGPGDLGTYRVIAWNTTGTTASTDALLAFVPVAAWGSGSSGETSLPIELTNAVQVAAGSNFGLGLRRDGRVVAWGNIRPPPADLTNAIAIAAGSEHAIALTAQHQVVSWGTGVAAQSPEVSYAVAIAAGAEHNLALLFSGTVYAWGNASGGRTQVPSDLTNVVAIAAGSTHSIALRADGKVIAWGDNSSKQVTVPTGLGDVMAIAAGAWHNLALKSDGTVAAWGADSYGQCDVPDGLSDVVAVSAGAFHSIALKSDGTLVTWGAGGPTNGDTFPHFGQSIIPTTVTHVSAIAAGATHTLSVAGDGAPYITASPIRRTAYSGRRVVLRAEATGAWPLRYQWQFGGKDIPGATSQVLIIENAYSSTAGIYRVIVSNELGSATSGQALLILVNSAPFIMAQPIGRAAYLGTRYVLSVGADGSGPLRFQWRLNGANIPGATNADLIFPRVLVKDSGDYSVEVKNDLGTRLSTKAALKVLQVVGWGASTNTGSYYQQTLIPEGLSGVVQVGGGEYHSLALKSDGTVVGWGGRDNRGFSYDYGQIRPPAGLSNVTAIAAGSLHSLALRSDGTVVAWGTLPQRVVPSGLSNVVAIYAAASQSAALQADGNVVVWGENVAPAPSTATNFIGIAGDQNSMIGLRPDGTVLGWGPSFDFLPRGSNILALASGSMPYLGLRADGTVATWGNSPAPQPGLSNVVKIAGAGCSLALRNDGTVVAWGSTFYPELLELPPGLTNVIDIATGPHHNLAALGDGSPVITAHPSRRVACPGGETMFHVMAVGIKPLSYQWQLNGTDLQGATNDSLRLTNLRRWNAGEYRVIITNAFGNVTSRAAVLGVYMPLGQALNSGGLVWNSSGDSPWWGEVDVFHDGSDAAQCGTIGDSQQSTLQAAVFGPGTLSFWWKVSSEANHDLLSFNVDGEQRAWLSGEVDWQLMTLDLGGGTHNVSWNYSKDGSISAGQDAGWVDQVLFQTNPPVILEEPADQVVSMGGTVVSRVVVTGAPPFFYQWSKDGVGLAGATNVYFQFVNAGRVNSGTYAVAVRNLGGTTTSRDAKIQVRVPQQLTSTLLPGGGFALSSIDANGSSLSSDDLPRFDIQASTNLQDWTVLTNALTCSNGFLLFNEPGPPNYPTRFYRIIEHPH